MIGCFSLTRTVSVSGEVSDTIGASGLMALTRDERVAATLENRSQENSTSSISTVRPFTGGLLWNLTPDRSFITICVPSGDHSQDLAKSPTITPFARSR